MTYLPLFLNINNKLHQALNSIILVSLTLIFILHPDPAIAQTATSSYKLQWSNLNSAGNQPKTSTPATQSASIIPPSFSGQQIQAGFPYINQARPFTFTISNISINFPETTANTFFKTTATLTVNPTGTSGYQVLVSQNHPLKLEASTTTIPNTDCNSGCHFDTANTWTNPDKIGFGYNMSGHDIPTDFATPNHFKPFPSLTLNQPAQTIMSNQQTFQPRLSIITYQLNINHLQASGNYQNTINFTALPNY